jgi:thymidine kinase
MDISKQHIVQLTFIDKEAALFLSIMDKIVERYSKETGFKKIFTLDEIQFLKEFTDQLYESESNKISIEV